MSDLSNKLRAAREQRTRHLQAWRASGVTQAAYCRAQGLNATTFSGWLSSERSRQGAGLEAISEFEAQRQSQPRVAPKPTSLPQAQPERQALSVRTLRVVAPKPSHQISDVRSELQQRLVSVPAPILVRAGGGVCIEFGADTSTERLARFVAALNGALSPSC